MTSLAEAIQGTPTAFMDWRPRPDQPERYDQQESFYWSRHPGVTFLIGGNGCIAADSQLYDPVARRYRRADQPGPFHIWCRDPLTGRKIIGLTPGTFRKGTAALFRVTLSNGGSFVATLFHRVLTAAATWLEIGQLRVGDTLAPMVPNDSASKQESFPDETPWSLSGDRDLTSSRSVSESNGQYGATDASSYTATNPGVFARTQAASASCCAVCPLSFLTYAAHLSQTAPSSLDRCSEDFRQCDGQLRFPAGIDPKSFRRRDDVIGRDRREHWDDLGRRSTRIPLRSYDLLSSSNANARGFPEVASRIRCALTLFGPDSLSADICGQGSCANVSPATRQSAIESQFQKATDLCRTRRASWQLASRMVPALFSPTVDNISRARTSILSIDFVRNAPFYDLTVWPHANYWMDGAWHHNSGTSETALAKVAKFVLREQEAPRPDTPFWILGNSYELICETAWKEKLYGHAHILDNDIQWPRVAWLSEKNRWPSRVPLRPWMNGNRPHCNWSLEFKSYGQGRDVMQARSLGGFLFVEQFPWMLLTEVLRGCREYQHPGGYLAEFTPVEPNLSDQLEDMETEDKLPADWGIYRCNTEEALAAGHVTREWFQNFFGMVPEDMRQTRMTGAWPSYEGVIYPTFNRAIHCVDMTQRTFPPGVFYRRSIDWGAGPDNPFACVWAFRTSAGNWCIYDEYYSNDITRSVIDHLKAVQDKWPWPNNLRYGTTWADPSDPGYFRIAARLSQYAPGYQNMNLSAASNKVTQGIDHVKQMLQVRPGLASPFEEDEYREDGYPQLLICSVNCKNLIREMRSYRWLKSNEAGLNPRDARREPLKRNDHLMDSLRYLLFSEAVFGTKSPHAKVDKELRTVERGIQLRRESQQRQASRPEDDPLKKKRNRGVGYGGG